MTPTITAFAAATIEPPIVDREFSRFNEHDKPWYEARQPIAIARVAARLHDLSAYLGAKPWLDGAFTAGDLLMIEALRRPAASPALDDFPNLKAYVARGEARPAFKRAFAAQLAVFEASQA